MSHAAYITLAFALLSCGGDFEDKIVVACPDVASFASVSPVLEKRCGSLDCHGSIARPLKVFGSYGLRLYDATEVCVSGEICDYEAAKENLTFGGGKPTTSDEHEQTRRSVCGLEPERTNQVVRGERDPRELMLLRKPLLIERHKGGQLLLKGGAGAVCIESWLRGEVEVADCQLAAAEP
jgi:hypothetical protein